MDELNILSTPLEGFADLDFAEDNESALYSSGRRNTNLSDPDLRGFRNPSTKNLAISWNLPGYLLGDDVSKDEQDDATNELLERDKVVSLRGVVVKVAYGMELANYDDVAERRTVYCHSTQATHQKGNLTEVIKSPLPLSRPIMQAHLKKDNEDTYHTPSRDLTDKLLLGSRGLSCAECVAAGQHYVGDLIADTSGGKEGLRPTVATCKGIGTAIFYVTHVGVQVEEEKYTPKGRPYTERSLEWKPITSLTFSVPSSDGTSVTSIKRFERPVLIRLRVNRLSMFDSLATPRLDVDYTHHTYLNPSMNLQTLSDYYRFLLSDENKIYRKLNDNSFCFPLMTDIHFIQPVGTAASRGLGLKSKVMPVFCASNLTPEEQALYTPEQMKAIVLSARAAYVTERAMVPGATPEPLPEAIEAPVRPTIMPGRTTTAPQALRSAAVAEVAESIKTVEVEAQLPPRTTRDEAGARVFLQNLSDIGNP